jgi:hypothetical protein
MMQQAETEGQLLRRDVAAAAWNFAAPRALERTPAVAHNDSTLGQGPSTGVSHGGLTTSLLRCVRSRILSCDAPP